MDTIQTAATLWTDNLKVGLAQAAVCSRIFEWGVNLEAKTTFITQAW
jgi:hypothetical protein